MRRERERSCHIRIFQSINSIIRVRSLEVSCSLHNNCHSLARVSLLILYESIHRTFNVMISPLASLLHHSIFRHPPPSPSTGQTPPQKNFSLQGSEEKPIPKFGWWRPPGRRCVERRDFRCVSPLATIPLGPFSPLRLLSPKRVWKVDTMSG
jgi:hypothetical protein